MPRSPLIDKLESLGARMMPFEGWDIPASFGSVEQEYWTLKRAAGFHDLSHRGRLLVRGKDAPRFLHGMVTNDVQGLAPGQGNYAFLLNVQGHILADLRILRLDASSFLLDCEPQSHRVVAEALERHIIMDEVEVEDHRASLACLALEGPGAGETLRAVLGDATTGIDLAAMKSLDHVFIESIAARIVRTSYCGGDGWWILAPPERAGKILDTILAKSDGGTAAKPVGFEAVEICRIEAGIPRYGIDITEKNLPQETAQMHAISFNKGCYIGQEVVERIRSQGHVNRLLVRLVMDSRRKIAPETTILSEGELAGATTSSAYSFGMGKTVALGYVRREYAVAGTKVTVDGASAEVTELTAIAGAP